MSVEPNSHSAPSCVMRGALRSAAVALENRLDFATLGVPTTGYTIQYIVSIVYSIRSPTVKKKR